MPQQKCLPLRKLIKLPLHSQSVTILIGLDHNGFALTPGGKLVWIMDSISALLCLSKIVYPYEN